MVYFDESYLTIKWDEKVNCVIMEWKGRAQGDKLRTGLDKGLELVVQKKASKWLADTGLLGTFGKDDQQWANENWFPRALAAGIKQMAVIVPKSALSRMSVDAVMSKVPGTDLTSAYFDNQEAAKKWLSSEQ